MKKILINYYALIIILLFLIYNLLLRNLVITGIMYHLFMITLIISNIILLFKLKKEIKCKSIAIIVFFIIWIFSKDIYGVIFGLSSMITLISIGFIESNLIKIISIIITIIISIIALPLFYLFILVFALSGGSRDNQIYEDTHYYCSNNTEIYSYSAGAMDRFHYSMGKHYVILDFNDIIYISYNEQRNEVSQKEYSEYLKTHKCKLVGDVNGFK